MSDERDAGWDPLDPDEHAAQLADLQNLIQSTCPKEARLLDLGCGDGRIAAPVAGDGRRIVCVDSDPRAVRRCEEAGLEAVTADFLDPAFHPAPNGESFHGAWCLGHTFMLVHDVDQAVELMTRLRQMVACTGWFAIDAFCESCWRDVAEGAWQTGVSDDGGQQLIWAPGDNVFALREGEDVDASDWTLGPSDTRHRLWSMGELTLLARASGWRPPEISAGGALLVFHNAALAAK